MGVLKISSERGESHLEIGFQEISSVTNNQGDALISISVESSGFKGSTQCWVVNQELLAFSKDLAELNKNLKGLAKLSSISPGEFTLNVRSITSRGHMAVSGQVGFEVIGIESSHWHSITYGFEFEQSQISQLLAGLNAIQS